MPSLYEIDNQIESIVEKFAGAFDEVTGEIIDEELYTESQKQLDNLEIAQNDKIENIACFIKNLHSDVFALENEIKTLSQRKKVKENQLKRIKEYLANFLKLKGIKKIETPKAVVSFRKSEVLEIEDEELIIDWCRYRGFLKEKPEIDKAKVKKYIKELIDDDEKDLCPTEIRIVEKQNLQIK
jgi:hypothetical protein